MQDIQDKPLTPVDQAAGNGKPYDEPVISAFLRQVERRPDATAIRYLGERFSYRRLAQLIDQFAASLAELGVEAGDKAMIYLPNCPQWVIAYFGIQRIGAAPCHLAHLHSRRDPNLINDSGIRDYRLPIPALAMCAEYGRIPASSVSFIPTTWTCSPSTSESSANSLIRCPTARLTKAKTSIRSSRC